MPQQPAAPAAPQQPWGGQPVSPAAPQQPWGGQPVHAPAPQQPWGGAPAHPVAPTQPWGGAPGPQPGMPGGDWRPPPRPGLLPLRPLTLGDILGATFQVMRRNPLPTFGLALLLNAALGIITVGLVGGMLFLTYDRSMSADAADQDAIWAGGVAGTVVAFLVSLALQLVVTAIVQGLVALEVARGTLGERLRLAGLWRRLKPRLGALIGWAGIITGVNLLVIGVVGGGLFALGTLGGSAIGIAIGLGVLFFLAYIVAAIWIGTKLIFVPSAITLERRSIRGAVARSWTLIRGSFWKTFGIYLLVNVIYSTASQIITTPISFIGGIIGGATGADSDPNDPTGMFVTLGIIYAATLVVSLVVSAIGTVMLSATTSILFIDLRMRREGLDLELIRFVEGRAGGATDLRDPYEAPAPGMPGAPGAGGPGTAGWSGDQPAGAAAPGASTPYPPSSGSPWA
ncbi:glycerophosphoryl diester phosphodiesterase membrane domain-containing protein [Schumannella sp. 10F1B-5-1]|uniref:glycerophosphoryl diester phosphodiesterase membrane domain-containing protein n=1 Tax=Schumannella sp. 10F1B-5-1 TaxID=2590780 RepID=UPI001130A420|nr:glycerophosphoryl diester phosphodiesterase membrane domain-containing protein [Schumannella sp. 10F1B-5-1]TPW73585.1 hypothetical protein FJ658_05220 [Schumannella sp. 10F1B-5-1]